MVNVKKDLSKTIIYKRVSHESAHTCDIINEVVRK